MQASFNQKPDVSPRASDGDESLVFEQVNNGVFLSRAAQLLAVLDLSAKAHYSDKLLLDRFLRFTASSELIILSPQSTLVAVERSIQYLSTPVDLEYVFSTVITYEDQRWAAHVMINPAILMY